MRTCAHCVSPTARTRCITVPSPAWSSPGTPTCSVVSSARPEAAAFSADEAFTGTKAVEERHRLDEGRLATWMQDNVEGFRGPLIVLQFKGGQSNPTYRLDTPHASYVLRRKPFGKLLP